MAFKLAAIISNAQSLQICWLFIKNRAVQDPIALANELAAKP